MAYAKTLIYQKLPDPKDKFIVAYKFDMGYSYAETALALGCTYKTVWERVKKIRAILGKHYQFDITEGNDSSEKLLE